MHWGKLVEIVAASWTKFYFPQRSLRLVSQRFQPLLTLDNVSRNLSRHDMCVLWHKLYVKLHSVTAPLVVLAVCWILDYIVLSVRMNLLVRAACEVVTFELVLSSIFLDVYDGWSSLSVSRTGVTQRSPSPQGRGQGALRDSGQNGCEGDYV